MIFFNFKQKGCHNKIGLKSGKRYKIQVKGDTERYAGDTWKVCLRVLLCLVSIFVSKFSSPVEVAVYGATPV